MNGRFAPAVVAFCVATALVCAGRVLPEFFVQLRDPNLLGGPIFTWLLHIFGYAFVLALCAVLTGGALLLVAWRTRLRGASDWFAAFAAVLVVLCFTGRFGVSLDPIGWICAASLCLLLERKDRFSGVAAVAVTAVWSLLQGGATLGALLAILAAVNDRTKTAVAALCSIAGLLQLHALPWRAYGAHLLYLDSLTAGAQRDRVWSTSISVPALGFAALVVLAAWYGLKRRSRPTDAWSFFILLLLTLADARNLPYFGIVAAPIVADSFASYYVGERKAPRGSISSYLPAFCAGAFAFIATLTVSEPKTPAWPAPPGAPVKIFALLQRDGKPHEVLCVIPRWCDTAAGALHPIMSDRAGLASPLDRKIQTAVVASTGPWRADLRLGHVDAIVSGRRDQLVSLLRSTGWRLESGDGVHVLLEHVR